MNQDLSAEPFLSQRALAPCVALLIALAAPLGRAATEVPDVSPAERLV